MGLEGRVEEETKKSETLKADLESLRSQDRDIEKRYMTAQIKNDLEVKLLAY